MRIVHFVKDLDLSSGGPTRSVPALAEWQSRINEYQVSVVFGESAKPCLPDADTRVAYIPVKSGIWTEKNAIPINPHSLFHIHGLWSPLLHRAVAVARARHMPYVISTRGMMAGWALQHKAFKKRIAWLLYQKNDLQKADRIVVSSEFEKAEVMNRLPQSAFDVMPNGCHPKPNIPALTAPLLEKNGVRWALAMGRLHPVKGYRELIDAWAAVAPGAWKLAIAGPDESNHLDTLKSLVSSHGLARQVIFLGTVDDHQKWQLFEQCELFLAPSRTENFGMAIAEALQSGTPVITTTGTPWQMIPQYNCGWWIELDDEALKSALTEATQLSAETLANMGQRGQKLISENFTWDAVAAKSLEIYQSVLEMRRSGSPGATH